MMLSPKARRLVAEAVRDLPDAKARDTWRAWAEEARPGALPQSVAVVALDALQLAARQIKDRLESGVLDEDRYAELANDLGFIRAVASDLQREVASRQHQSA